MAAENAFLGGYKVGLISASLLTKGDREGKKRKKNKGLIFDSSETSQPTFIPVKKKVKMFDILLPVDCFIDIFLVLNV